jgi:hypothetical protein
MFFSSPEARVFAPGFLLTGTMQAMPGQVSRVERSDSYLGLELGIKSRHHYI